VAGVYPKTSLSASGFLIEKSQPQGYLTR